MRRNAIWWLACMVFAATGYIGGWQIGRDSVQSANGLIDAGYIIIDSDGSEVWGFSSDDLFGRECIPENGGNPYLARGIVL